MKMVSGWWSDRVRRRKPLVVAGYALAAVARPLVGLATSWGQVLAIRFADRVGKGIRTSPRDALLADLVPPEKRGRAFGLQRAMDNAGAVVGPAARGAAPEVRLRRRALRLPARRRSRASPPSCCSSCCVPRERRGRARAGPRAGPRTDGRGAAACPRASGSPSAIFVLFTLASSTDAFLLLKARDAGIAVWQLPLLWAFFNGVKAAAGVPGGALADRLGPRRTIVAGWAVYAALLRRLRLRCGAGPVWALFAFYALFYALTEGAERALVADLVAGPTRAAGPSEPSTRRVGLAALPASILFGVWWKVFGPRAAFLDRGRDRASLATAALLAFRLRAGEPTCEVLT